MPDESDDLPAADWILDELAPVTDETVEYLRRLMRARTDRRIGSIHTSVGHDWIHERWEQADAARLVGTWPDLPDMEPSLTNAAAVEEAALSGACRRRRVPSWWRKRDRGTHPTRLCYPRLRRPKLDRTAWACVAVYVSIGLLFLWTLWLCRPR